MTTTYDDPNAFLMGGGIPAAQFDTIGTTVTGAISALPEVIQQTDPKDGSLKFWDDGKPRMQLVVTVQTDLRDPEIADDDGLRKFYVKAKLQDAVRQAVRASGARGLEIGGTLAITYTGDGEQKNRAFNPPKLYSARYTAPAQAAANDFLNGGQQAAPGAIAQMPQQASQRADALYQAAQQQLAAQQPAADGGAVWTPPPGMDPTQAAALAALPPAQRAALGYP